MSVGKLVRDRRERLKKDDPRFSLRQVALRIGVQPGYLSRFERGEPVSLSEEKLKALAHELGESPDHLLALCGKISSDVREAIRERPVLFSRLIRELRGLREETDESDLVREHLQRQQDGLQAFAHVGSWRMDRTGNLIFSRESRHLFGIESEGPHSAEMFLNRLHPSDRPAVREALERIRSERTSFGMEFRFENPAGETRHGRFIALTETASDKAASSEPVIHGYLQDVTELIQAQQTLRDYRSRFSALFRHALDAFLLADDKGRLVDANPAALRMTGYNADEMRDLTPWRLAPGVDEKLGYSLWQSFIREGSQEGDYTIRRKNGTILHAEYKAVANILPGLHLSVLRDVTRRKNAEESLSLALKNMETRVEERTRDLTHNSERLREELERRHEAEEVALLHERKLDIACRAGMVGTWEWRPDDGILEFDPSAKILLGLSEDEEIDMQRWQSMIHPDDLSRVLQTMADHLEGRKDEYSCVFRVRLAGGNTRWLLVRARALREEDGSQRLIGSSTDITEMKATQQAAEESEHRFRTLIEHLPVLIDALDESGLTVLWNKECERVTGYAAEEIINNPDASRLLIPDPKYRERMVSQMSEAKSYRDWEWEITCKNGEKRVIAWSNIARLVPIDGWPIWGCGVDVTERVRAREAVVREQERLRYILDSLPAMIFLKDEHNRLISLNRTCREILGLEEGADPTAMEDIGPASLAKSYLENDLAVLRSGVPRRNIFEQLPTDPARWFKTDKIPYRDLDGRVIGVLGYAAEITELKTTQDALVRSLEEKELLVREVHHRVKNNLQIVSALLDMSARRSDSDYAAGIIQDVRDKIHAMAIIHNRLFRQKDLERIDAGPLARDIANSLNSGVSGRSAVIMHHDLAHIHLSLEQAIPFGLILNEAVTNVLKHAYGEETPVEDRRMDIELRKRETMVELVVRDHGKGLEEDFDLAGATSLGLKLIRNLSHQLKGEATLVSDNGTRLHVLFPLAPGLDS